MRKQELKQSPFSPAASPVSPSPPPESGGALRMNATCGRRCAELLPNCGPVGCLGKMLLASSIWGSTKRSLTWQKRDTLFSHSYFRLAASAHGMSASELLSSRLMFPTPLASDKNTCRDAANLDVYLSDNGIFRKKNKDGSIWSLSLSAAVYYLTPAASEGYRSTLKPEAFRDKSIIPTKAGINLVTVLPDTLTSPMLTAEWEQKLTAIARGEADPAEFMAGITGMARELVQKYSHISEEGQKLFAPEREAVGLCPRCGKPVYEGKKNFYCSDRSCQFVLWKDDRFWTSRKKELTKKMAGDLLKKGRTSVKGMWSEKKGSTYDAVVVLDDTGGKYVRFKLEFPKRKEGLNGR